MNIRKKAFLTTTFIYIIYYSLRFLYANTLIQIPSQYKSLCTISSIALSEDDKTNELSTKVKIDRDEKTSMIIYFNMNDLILFFLNIIYKRGRNM